VAACGVVALVAAGIAFPSAAADASAAQFAGSTAQSTTVPSPLTITVTTSRPVIVPPKAVYHLAPAPVKAVVAAPGAGSVSRWWADSALNNSSLTMRFPGDDSKNVFIGPTSPIQLHNTGNQPDSAAGAVWSGVGLTSKTNGQLIAVIGRESYICSGTVVHSPHRNLVVTAGHCAWNIPVGQPHSAGGAAMTQLERIWFIPGASQLTSPLQLDADGIPELSAPAGIWKVDTAYSSQRWMENTWITETGEGASRVEHQHGAGALDDIAFLTLDQLDGADIESVTGAQGLMFSDTSTKAPQLSYPTVVLGYPAAPPFDGTTERFCAQRTPDLRVSDGLVRSATVTCALNPGSSGGAWFTGFDNTEGAGYVYGVTSIGGDQLLTAGLLSLASDYPLYQRITR